ncbi:MULTISPECIES: siderophore-interacting protein [unclassified Corallococcus]|uniref:siderophore-interacting protein n=1 Tax=unclassified Corallococcus TaxID=2685029 RepID=UPI001A8DF432|nr:MULTISPECIES: siderophore-interacting protein [unclassified Corallococcus]MBN9684813.1 siderophore-interacting protein [Corallococcus sp. NCSPR001]WAS83720.1 siderophore-interacting protein [Corallococcus sp. NCRR]
MSGDSERVARRGPFPVKLRLLEVQRVTRLSPHMVRVTLGGPELEGFSSPGADDHVKCFFAKPGVKKPDMPVVGPHGLSMPEGLEKPASRDYTPRRFDPQANELDIDFVLHGEGPASLWAQQAKPGDFMGIGGPRSTHDVADDFDWYLLAGDQSALPAIARRLEELPAGRRAFAFIEVADAAEEQPIVSKADVKLTWLHRGSAEAGTTKHLEDALRAWAQPAGEGFVFVAGEANSLKPIREHLVNERGLNKSWMRVTGYWKRGVAEHHDAKG